MSICTKSGLFAAKAANYAGEKCLSMKPPRGTGVVRWLGDGGNTQRKSNIGLLEEERGGGGGCNLLPNSRRSARNKSNFF